MALQSDVAGRERRRATGSDAFSLLTCLDSTTFVLLSVFTLVETIYFKICAKPLEGKCCNLFSQQASSVGDVASSPVKKRKVMKHKPM